VRFRNDFQDLARSSRLLIIVASVVFSAVAHADFDLKYIANSGDLDGNGYNDVFLYRAADVNVVYFDNDLIVPIVKRRAEGVVLMQDSSHVFTVNSSPTTAQIATMRNWTRSQVQLKAVDLNVDGKQDLVLKNFAADSHFSAVVPDQIIYAAKGASPIKAVAITSSMRDFFTQAYGWYIDHAYFIKKATDNGWYHYTGTLVEGWFPILYINNYYTYRKNANSPLITFLDSSDVSTDQNNTPAYCEDFPAACRFNVTAGTWEVYGTFRQNIQVVYELTNFNQNAVSFALTAAPAYSTVNSSADPTPAVSYVETQLGAPSGGSVADMMAYPLPRPEMPPEATPEPPLRQIQRPIPPIANEPTYTSLPQLKWVLAGKVLILACTVICYSDVNVDEGELMKWYHFGWEWALDDMLRRQDPSAPVKAIIGEGEGRDSNNVELPYVRIPSAAANWQALYLTFGVDPVTGQQAPFSRDGDPNNGKFMWSMNSGWLAGLMAKQAVFYDIQLWQPRIGRGVFYPCERRNLANYPLREEQNWMMSFAYTSGTCVF